MQESQPNTPTDLKKYIGQVKKITGKLFPLVFVVAVLPALVVLTASFKSLSLSSSAKGGSQLRLFFEPKIVTTKVNEPVKLRLTAAYDTGDKLASGFSAVLTGDSSLKIFPQRVEHKLPFRGRVFGETIEVIPQRSGTFTLEIPVDQVVSGTADMQVVTIPATIIVPTGF